MGLDDFLVILYVLIDDWWLQNHSLVTKMDERRDVGGGL
jgi:hypothetical protein